MTALKRLSPIVLCGMLFFCGCSDEPVGPGDELPPFITWLSPLGDTLLTADTITVQFAAADDGGVISKIDVYVNNALNKTITSAPYRTVLDFSALAGDADYPVYAVAFDPSGKSRKTQDTLYFTKRVSPLIDWKAPSSDTTLTTDTATIQFDVIDPRGTLDSVVIYVAGVSKQSLTAPPFTTVLNLSAYGNNRAQQVYASAIDTTGLVKSTTSILTFHKALPPDTATWTLLSPALSPSARYEHSLSLDAAGQRAVLFGGLAEPSFEGTNDAWMFSFATNTWDSIEATGTIPGPRTNHGAAVISGNRLLIFGGESAITGADTLLQDCDALDLSTFEWSYVDTFPRPTARMAVAALNYEIYAYGGAIDSDDNGIYEATEKFFRFNGTAWNDITMTSGAYPGARFFASVAADAENNQMFVFGGTKPGTDTVNASNYRMDVNTLQWVSTAAPGPPRLYGTALTFDSLNNRILLWGGALATGGYLTELWQFSLGSNSWTIVPTTGAQPSGRRAHQMVIDAPNHRIIMFGGDVSGSLNGETWELAW